MTSKDILRTQYFFKDLLPEIIKDEKSNNEYLKPFSIDLLDYDLTSEDIYKLINLIIQSEFFTKLSIRLSDTIKDKECIVKLLRKISLKKQFTHLSFYVKNLEDESLEIFYDFLSKIHENVVSLKIKSKYHPDKNKEVSRRIIESISKLNKNTMEELSLDSIDITDEMTIKNLNEFLSKTNVKNFFIARKRLHTLELNLTKIESLQVIYTNISSISSLPILNLDLAFNNLSINGLTNLSNLLGKDKSLQKLSLISCNIGDDGCEILAEGLKTNNTLLKLNLERNNILNRGLVALAHAIKTDFKNKVTRVLNDIDFSFNYIDDAGIEEFTQILHDESDERFVNLEFKSNNISSEGYVTLTSFLKYQQNIKNFSILNNNKMSEVSNVKTFQNLKELKNLENLYMYKPDMVEDSINSLQELLKENKNLTNFILTNAKEMNDSFLNQIFIGLESKNKLETLVLSQCNITDNTVEILANSLFNNMAISEINLEQNSIGEKGIKALSEKVLRKTCLKSINLGHNLLDEKAAFHLGEALQDAMGLETLLLNSNKIQDMGVEYIAKGLSKNNTLCEVNLENNQITDNGLRTLSNVLKDKEKIIKLNLASNNITEIDDDTYSLFDWFYVLKIADNPLCQSAIAKLFQGSEHNRLFKSLRFRLDNYYAFSFHFKCYNLNLKAIDLSHNNYNASLMKHICGLKNLTKLNLQNNNISDGDLEKLLKDLIEKESKIKVLLLQSNKITEKGAKYLSDFLKENKTLKELNLAGNAILDEGLKYICESLSSNNSLEELLINYTKVSDASSRDIYNMLVKNKSLLVFSILGNLFQDEGIDLILSALRVNKSLRAFSIGNIKDISEKAFENLDDYLLFNDSLRVIELKECNLSDGFIVKLGKAIKNNKTLEKINLVNNNIGAEGMLKFAQRLYKNEYICDAYLFLNKIKDTEEQKMVQSANGHLKFNY